jgi:hypothetical protein
MFKKLYFNMFTFLLLLKSGALLQFVPKCVLYHMQVPHFHAFIPALFVLPYIFYIYLC